MHQWKEGKYLVYTIRLANSKSSKYCQRRPCLIPKLSILPHYWNEKYFSLHKIQFLYFSLMNTSSFCNLNSSYHLQPFELFELRILLRLPFLLFLTLLPSSHYFSQRQDAKGTKAEILNLKHFSRTAPSSKAFRQLDNVPLTIIVIGSCVARAHFQLTVSLSSCKTVKLWITSLCYYKKGVADN